jgi:glutamate synthase (NADPH/NADH) large chain
MDLKNWYNYYHPAFPANKGLYDNRFEKDACGAGFICHMKGEKSHDLIQKALEILINLTHRGATGSDPTTGDGAGILIQKPHRFLKKVCQDNSINLPEETDYASGIVFLPKEPQQREYCQKIFQEVIKGEEQEFLGWRKVPTNRFVMGNLARKNRPSFRQIFIGKGKGIKDLDHFERKLYVIRKIVEKTIRESTLSQKHLFYVTSLSSKIMVYKGLLLPTQIQPFYIDLQDSDLESALALVHQRYSTNTFPTWDLAQPFRFLCHNGEINTLRGNVNWILSRQSVYQSSLFGKDLAKLFPIATPGASDSAILDNVAELLYQSGRSLPHVIMMLIPEAWEKHPNMSDQKKAFYEYHSCLMEPWDGPASIPFTDGRLIGAVLDRNGLRPSRYTITKDNWIIMGSETGVVEIDPQNVLKKGRLEPGRMFLIDIEQGRIIEDEEIKEGITSRKPYRQWLNENLVKFTDLPTPKNVPGTNFTTLKKNLQKFGYSFEDLKLILLPMAQEGKEPLGSMGDDTPLAVLSSKPRLLYDYFKQLFAQVTNPPLDAIREELVTSLVNYTGKEHNILDETPEHCHQFKLDQPILTNEQLLQIREMFVGDIRAITIPILYKIADGGWGLRQAIRNICLAASRAVDDGVAVIILSDRGGDENLAPIPAVLATAAVHHHLISEMKRTNCSLVIESGEPREVHHFCVLIGYGASAINPYLAYQAVDELHQKGWIKDISSEIALQNYIKAASAGILKVMSKMGISTLQSYQGAQIFEAVGLNQEVIDKYFVGTTSRIGGVDLDTISQEVFLRHQRAYPGKFIRKRRDLEDAGLYQWRRRGEYHQFNPLTIAKLQQATREKNKQIFREFSQLINKQNQNMATLRGLFEFKKNEKAIPLSEVEPWTEIVKRVKTGAMSYGSISKEAHETLAIAMNRIGGKSNSGEGGEDFTRFYTDKNGDSRNSAIKQVASGRFGVTIEYLVHAQEIQIKMSQGAKPGEGGQLPGWKVYPDIARIRHSTPYVGLISPPPHHDIYSIEDLAQLIYDLKNANPEARINVKLVSEIGVGTVAAGVAKGKADVVLISGHDGGTGASPLTAIKHSGLPWELGLAETHQTLVVNNLRDRIVVECDGQLKTGRDVAIACLLGAEEFGFATSPLVTLGCVMMRVCHKNTCPVGVATQDPHLRAKFQGKPDYVINYMYFVAEELREIMASLGFHLINEMVGRVDRLEMRQAVDHWKAREIDLSRILYQTENPSNRARYCQQKQDHGLEHALDHEIIKRVKPALENGKKVSFELNIRNVHRTVGTILSSQIAKKYGAKGLPQDAITIHLKGSAGQSFCAFGARGLTMYLEGDANDYLGKGLSGAKLIIKPPTGSTFAPEENILIGNVAFYGATSGEAYINGLAGERFCVRNSGVKAVVEGVGDHGCEYMTGGRVVVLGKTGLNFAAGMSGGIAYVLDEKGDFGSHRCNLDMVNLEALVTEDDIMEVRKLIENHLKYTKSTFAKRVLDNWDMMIGKFVKIMPIDYKNALELIESESTGVVDEEDDDYMLEVPSVHGG